VGCAEAGRYIVRRPQLGLTAHGDEVTYVSLGEGATSEGEFWESLNTACVEHLPVLFVVADNGYAISVPASEQSPAPINELVRGFAGLQVRSVDGTDYFAVRRTARKVISQIRAGVGPALIHARVTRPYSHSAADTQSKYRVPQEIEWELAHDPIDNFERVLIEGGRLTADQARGIREDARRIVAEAAKAACAAPRPDVKTVLDHVVALPEIPDPGDPPTDGEPVALGEAIRRALHDVMEADERIRVFGEDVADAREAILAGSRARAACSARPTGSSAVSDGPAATTPRWPRPTSSAGRSAREFGGCGQRPRSSSSTTSGPRCSRSAARRPPSAGGRTASSPAPR
jgi:2-oxoisovalerate dehydrogenase E1 component